MNFPKMMIFIRRAAALEPAEFDGEEYDRPLTHKGVKKARAAFKVLTEHYMPTRVISSPRARALETARLLSDAAIRNGGDEPSVETSEALGPNGTVELWRTALSTLLPPLSAKDVVAVVGHSPSLEAVLSSHLGVSIPASFSKASFAVLEMAAVDSARLIAFVPAKLFR